MNKFKFSYTDKTKLREIDKDSLISRLSISERQFYRIQQKYLKEKNLDHGLCGKASNNIIPDVLKIILLTFTKPNIMVST